MLKQIFSEHLLTVLLWALRMTWENQTCLEYLESCSPDAHYNLIVLHDIQYSCFVFCRCIQSLTTIELIVVSLR